LESGKYSSFAGHDINYIALSGALSLIGPSEKPPTFPANLLGDFAGGAALCVIGILMALLERQNSGKGQVGFQNLILNAYRKEVSFTPANST
jgi:alpha-methylacyl-CoA racemase